MNMICRSFFFIFARHPTIGMSYSVVHFAVYYAAPHWPAGFPPAMNLVLQQQKVYVCNVLCSFHRNFIIKYNTGEWAYSSMKNFTPLLFVIYSAFSTMCGGLFYCIGRELSGRISKINYSVECSV